MSFGDKTEIRRAVRRRIAGLTAEQRTAKSVSIEKMLSDCDAIRGASVVALYASLADEPQTRGLIEILSRTRHGRTAARRGRRHGFLRIFAGLHGCRGIRHRRAFGRQSGIARRDRRDNRSRHGIHRRRHKARTRTRVLRPLHVAPGFRATKIGVCFAEQIVEHIPAEPHDIAVDTVVSA